MRALVQSVASAAIAAEAVHTVALKARDAAAEEVNSARNSEPPDRKRYAAAGLALNAAELALQKATTAREETAGRASLAVSDRKALDARDKRLDLAAESHQKLTAHFAAALESARPLLQAAQAATNSAGTDGVSLSARVGLQLAPAAFEWDGLGPSPTLSEIARHLAWLLTALEWNKALLAPAPPGFNSTPNAGRPWPKGWNPRVSQ